MKDIKTKKKKKEDDYIEKGKITVGQFVLGFFLLIYTLFCSLPVLLVFITAFTCRFRNKD